MLAIGFVAAVLVLTAYSVPTTLSKSITPINSNATLSKPTRYSLIFEMPNKIDDDDILEEYGRYIIGNMNQSIDPCENFYEYACGNWINTEIVPEKSRNKSAVSRAIDQLHAMLMNFLKYKTADELKHTIAESNAKLFFSSCLKMNKEMTRGYKEIWEMADFKKELKTMSENETFDWININFMSSFMVYPLLPLDVKYSHLEEIYKLHIRPPKALISTTDSEKLLRDFKIEDVADPKVFQKEFEDMLEFEKNLIAHGSVRNKTENLAFKDFLSQHEKDHFNWTRYFDIAFNGTKKPEWNVTYTIDDIVPLVEFLNKTELETLRSYVKWSTLIKFYNIWKIEPNKDKSVEVQCLQKTITYFESALTPWLIEQLFDADRRADISQIAYQIKQHFYDSMDNYTWLDDETKSNAKTKLSSMDILVGYTDDMRHEFNNQIYADANISEDWFKNILILEANRAKVRMFSINETKISFLKNAVKDVNSYYIPPLNSVYITMGLAQLPLYHEKFPASMKFGGIGFFIGHEIGHGFDSSSFHIDYNGKENNWWTESSLRNLKERFRCLESQYNKFIYQGVHSNGTQTSGEDIADSVGIRHAYAVYMNNYGKGDGDQRPLPGLNFTNNELFFLKYAQSWCTGKDDAFNINWIKTDAHSYEEFRVLVPLQNMAEFSEVFKCKLGSNMNPIKKCIVW